jgi:hypothetical protein
MDPQGLGRAVAYGPLREREPPLLRILETSFATLGFSATFSTVIARMVPRLPGSSQVHKAPECSQAHILDNFFVIPTLVQHRLPTDQGWQHQHSSPNKNSWINGKAQAVTKRQDEPCLLN